MIILNNPVHLYGKKVITDLATRSGPHTMDSYSYGGGLEYIAHSYFTDKETDANIDMLFESQTDFNPDIIKPQFTEEEYSETAVEEQEDLPVYNPAVDTYPHTAYYRRLEDIAPEYLQKYVTNIVYSICRYSGNLKAYKSKHKIQPTLVGNSGDNDDFTELADLQLQTDVNAWSPESKQNALQHLPYVLKRLHNLSCYCGIHILSFIGAYLKAQDMVEANIVMNRKRTFGRNDLIARGVYRCNKSGNITQRVTKELKCAKTKTMFDWICGEPSIYSSYYQDFINLLHYCKVLNIDLKNDDLTQYQADFASRLVVTTVTPNKQFSQQIFSALLTNNEPVNMPTEDIDIYDNTINLFGQACDLEPKLQEVQNKLSTQLSASLFKDAVTIHYTQMLYINNIVTEMDKYAWIDGYLHYDGELVEIPTSTISSRYFDVDRFIVSELGYAIQLTDKDHLFLMAIPSALSNLTNKITGSDSDYKEIDWWRVSL